MEAENRHKTIINRTWSHCDVTIGLGFEVMKLGLWPLPSSILGVGEDIILSMIKTEGDLKVFRSMLLNH